MKDKKENRILFGPGGCITREAISLYIDNALSESERKKVLKHSKACEICMDALEGAKHFGSGSLFQSHLHRMDNSAWRKRLEPASRNRRLFVGISSVAASLALLFGVYTVLKIQRFVEKEGPITTGQDVAVIEEDKQDSLPVDLLLMEEAKSEAMVKTQKEVNERSVSADKKSIKEPEIITEEIIIDDAVEIELADEMDYEISEAEQLQLDKIEIGAEEEDAEIAMFVAEAPQNEEAKGEAAATRRYKAADVVQPTTFKKKVKKSADDAYYVAEVMPMFRGGGLDEFNKYMVDSLKVILPDSILHQPIIVGFRVDTAGNVGNVKLISGTSSRTYNKEIIRLVKESPNWIPAQLNGQAIAVDQQLEVVFNDK